MRLAAALILALAALGTPTLAQTATAPALKAAFLYNFAKFVEWPPEALGPIEPISLCVVNDRTVADLLTELTRGRSIDGHPLRVQTMKLDSVILPACRLVYAAGLEPSQTAALVEMVGRRPILTVSDASRFAEQGGIVGLFIEKGTLGFAVNLDASQRAGVHLSSKLLSLAKIVKDDRDAVRR
jgi:hypothetical protein